MRNALSATCTDALGLCARVFVCPAVTVYIQRQRENVLFGRDFMRLKEVLYSFTPGQGPLAIDAGANAMPIEPRGFNRTQVRLLLHTLECGSMRSANGRKFFSHSFSVVACVCVCVSQELISAMTYSKAPEFVSMIELLIGTANFNRGLDLYHTKFSFSNATTDDWIRSMEEASGQELMPMANLWLRRSGHPHILYSGSYDAASKTYTLEMEQTKMPKKDPTPWIVPIDWSLVKDGKVIKEGIYRLSTATATFKIEGVESAPDFLSFARSWSYFGTHANRSASQADLVKQALTDPDVINRYFAYRAVVDAEKATIIESLKAGAGSSQSVHISAEFVQLHAAILFDDRITAGARAALLREGEDIHTRPDLSYLYWEIAHARTALLQAVWDAHAPRILALYNELQSKNVAGPHIHQLHDRALKHHLFTLIAAGKKRAILASRKPSEVEADVSKLAKELLASPFMSDQLFAFSQYLSGPASPAEKQSVMSAVRTKFAAHPDSIETYVGVISGLDSDDAPSLIRSLIADPQMFDVAQAGHARTMVRMVRRQSSDTGQCRGLRARDFEAPLRREGGRQRIQRNKGIGTEDSLWFACYCCCSISVCSTAQWAGLRKRSLLTDDGLALTVDLFLLVGKVNQYSAQSFLSALNDLSKFPRETQKKLVAAVRRMHEGLDKVKEESLYNQLTATLAPYQDL